MKPWQDASYERQKALGWPNQKRWLANNREARMLTYARTSAWQKNLSFNLTKEDIVIPTDCPVLGIPLFYTKGKRTANTPTLDRIDNSRGYEKGNVVVVSWRANDLKRDATLDELQRLAAFYGGLT